MGERIGMIAPFGLRMPSHLRDWVAAQAEEQDRSMNWVILRLLEKERDQQEKKKGEAAA